MRPDEAPPRLGLVVHRQIGELTSSLGSHQIDVDLTDSQAVLNESGRRVPRFDPDRLGQLVGDLWWRAGTGNWLSPHPTNPSVQATEQPGFGKSDQTAARPTSGTQHAAMLAGREGQLLELSGRGHPDLGNEPDDLLVPFGQVWAGPLMNEYLRREHIPQQMTEHLATGSGRTGMS